MYKVFYNDRVVYLKEGKASGQNVAGKLFSTYQNTSALRHLLEEFRENEQITELHLYNPEMEGLAKAFQSCFKCISAGGGVVLNEKGEFLVIERNGVWDLPKGKMEKGEDFETTALREVEEETGLRGLEIQGLLLSTFHTYPLKGLMVLKETRWFEMLWTGSGKPVLQSEEGISDYRWVKPGEGGFIQKNTYASILDVLRLRYLLGTA